MLRSGKTVHYTHPMYANLLGGSIFTLALQYFNIVVLRKSSYETGGPTTAPEGNPLMLPAKTKQQQGKGKDQDCEPESAFVEIWRRMIWGISHFLDNRLSGTPWEVRNVPRFSKKDVDYVPSKAIFLRNNILRCLISVVLLDLGAPPADTSQNATIFADSKVPFFTRLSSVTTEEISMRLITTAASTTMTYLLFQAMYSAMAVLAVGLNLSLPERWRPLFGDFSEAWSLRRSWSTFWHQGIASCLTGPAKWFVFGVLRLPKSSLLARYLFTVVVFVLSGAMHLCGELTAGIPLSESGVLQFFFTQTLGLLIEDTVVGIWQRVVGGADRRARGWQKVVGLVWVGLWMAWSMPVWTYPASRRSEGEGILPFSIVDHLKG
jgi:hypothetical protein